MAITRISFSDYPDGGNSYSCPINPRTLDVIDSSDIEIIPVLDGTPIRSSSTFDDRIRTMKWDIFKVSNTIFTGMISQLKSYKGLNKILNLGDIDDAYSYGNRNIKIIDVSSELREGGELYLILSLTYSYLTVY